MKNKDTNNKNIFEVPNSEDEKYWDHYEEEFWGNIKRLKAALPKKEKCIIFARCREIAGATDSVSDFERQHLGKCRYCKTIVQEFIELSHEEEEITFPIPQKSFIQKLLDSFRFPKPEFAALGLLCAAALSGWLILSSIRQTSAPDEVTAVVGNESRTEIFNDKADITGDSENTNQTANSENLSTILKSRSILSDSVGGASAQKAEKPPTTLKPPPVSPASKVGANTQKPETPDNLEGVPADVIAELKAGKLSDFKDDFLSKPEPVTRGGNTKIKEPKPLSPVNHAVTEAKPVLKWQAMKNAEYVVTVKDRAGREKDSSGTLKQTSWQISEPLESGYYYWIVTAKKTDSEKTIELFEARFKVIAGQEKEKLENIERNVESRLAKAGIYHREGLFDEAERELQAELKKKPNSRRNLRLAGKFLRQVRETKQKLKIQGNQP